MKILSVFILLVGSVLLSSCMNMPTKSSQITGAYTSEVKYNSYDCDQLATELNSLARRENQLVIAQDQRRSSSQMQAFLYGYGTGDGIEASELATVRGEKEAVRRAMEQKHCSDPQNISAETQAEK